MAGTAYNAARCMTRVIGLLLGEDVMRTAKQEVEQLLHNLPDNSSIEDIQYHLYVLEKIRKGQDDIANGRSYTHEEARERLKKWLDL